MSSLLKSLAESPYFRNFITAVIILAGVVVGLQTYPGIVENYGGILDKLDLFILIIFVVEITIRIGAYGRHPLRFFTDPWNLFDFVIVFVCVLPLNSGFVAVLRLVRVLRVLRIVSVLPKLQILVGALLKSIPSIGYISVLLFLQFYIYACIGAFLFGLNDPVHFGNLHRSMLSLFQVVTLENWVDIMYIQFYGSDLWQYDYPDSFRRIAEARPWEAVLFFVSFILLGTMIILNLFIGVIMNGMAEMHAEVSRRQEAVRRAVGGSTVLDDVEELMGRLERVKDDLAMVRYRLVETGQETEFK